MSFKRAVRSQAKLKLAITGPSGSGKTYSSLLLASGLGSKIAVLDTESGSASLYADKEGMPEYDVLEMNPPYTVEKYRRAIRMAVDGGYSVLVIDSLTHAWAGEGGLLDKKEQIDATGRGNSYTNWAKITKEHEALKGEILAASIHIIVTMRSKQDYVLADDGNKKQAPRKVGLAPIQRDGMEYEFTTVFDVAMSHDASVSKDRSGIFDGRIFKITKDTGREIVEWLESGVELPKIAIAPPPVKAPILLDVSKSNYSIELISKIDDGIKMGVVSSDYLDLCLNHFGVSSVSSISYEQASKVINKVERLIRDSVAEEESNQSQQIAEQEAC